MKESKEYTLDLREIKFNDNLLDISGDNYGIIYSLLKANYDEVSVDYVESQEEKCEKELYNNAALFFKFSTIKSSRGRKELLKEISDSLYNDGEIYIWDYNKTYRENFYGKIICIISEETNKEFLIKDSNLIKALDERDILNAMNSDFDILDLQHNDEIFFIKAKKKGRKTYEDITSGDKLKIYSQQPGYKIFKRIYKGFKS